MLKWTKELPTESGFYRVEVDYDQIQMGVEVVADIVWMPGVEMEAELSDESFVAWCGPLKRPE